MNALPQPGNFNGTVLARITNSGFVGMVSGTYSAQSTATVTVSGNVLVENYQIKACLNLAKLKACVAI